MDGYRATRFMPDLVRQALEEAARQGFSHSCAAEVGRLLHLLAGQLREGPAGEVGTGCGVGAAWIVSALPPAIPFYTVELDPVRAAAARGLLAPFANARVIAGDWREILVHAPFSLLFADTKAKEQEPERLLQALAPGGLILLDDLTPMEHWPPEWHGRRDRVREFWLNDPRLSAVELRVTPTSAVILASRLR